MVLHNSKWDKKATKNYYRKHNIKPPLPKHLRDKTQKDDAENSSSSDEDISGKEYSDAEHHETRKEESSSEDEKSSEETEEKPIDEFGDKTKTGSTTLAKVVIDAAGLTEEDIARMKSGRKKKPGSNAWRYSRKNKQGYSKDDSVAELLAVQERNPQLKYDPEFQEVLKARQEEEVFEEDQLRLARDITTKKAVEEEERLRREEDEEEEREAREEEEALERLRQERHERELRGETKTYTLAELEDSDDEDTKSRWQKGKWTEEKPEDTPKKSNVKKLKDTSEYYSIQREIDKAATEAAIKKRFAGGSKGSGIGTASHLTGKTGAGTGRVLDITGRKDKGDDERLKQFVKDEKRHGSKAENERLRGAGSKFVSKGEEDIDSFLNSLDSLSVTDKKDPLGAGPHLESDSEKEYKFSLSGIPGLDSDDDNDDDGKTPPRFKLPVTGGVNKDQEAWLDNLLG
ncbi:uncharacterized protein SAPINGB_P004008 [Magnusiomyces paraingens]|uniref:Uncharacterized protein n=1 Tax=Magnusiomyces paraingens TaxID=2606893 RepID=A0A5E8BSB4_9ASCO|nr:uncharacterized protein SAPINGB_P004008 [Saprochaete ingens]VVT54303.1 unnamed protein product [Saprochaete ingens]